MDQFVDATLVVVCNTYPSQFVGHSTTTLDALRATLNFGGSLERRAEALPKRVPLLSLGAGEVLLPEIV